MFGRAGYNHEPVEAVGDAGFQDQRRFHDCNAMRIAAADPFHPLVFMLDHGGMNDGIEFLHAPCTTGMAERDLGKFGPVNTAVGIQDFPSEMADYFLIHRLPGLHQFVRNGVGQNQVRAEFDEHLADHRFAARNPASQPDL